MTQTELNARGEKPASPPVAAPPTDLGRDVQASWVDTVLVNWHRIFIQELVQSLCPGGETWLGGSFCNEMTSKNQTGMLAGKTGVSPVGGPPRPDLALTLQASWVDAIA